MECNNIDNDLTIEELKLLTKFTEPQLERFIKSIKLLISQNSAYDNILRKDIIDNCSEITNYLPQIKYIYLEQSVKQFSDILRILANFTQTYPNHSFTPSFIEVITAINGYFQRFHLSDSLSFVSPPIENEDEEKPLYQKVLNPSTDNSKEYSEMIGRMVKSAKSNGESDDNWKALAVGIKAIAEGKAETSPYIEAVSNLMLEGVNRLEQREKEFARTKQTVSELSLSADEIKKRKRDKLLDIIADNLFSKEEVD